MFYRPDFESADRDRPIGMDHLCLTVDGASMEELMDGTTVTGGDDNRFLSRTAAGVQSDRVQINVRNFKVIGL